MWMKKATPKWNYPNEILLHIFSVLLLISLIAVQGIDQKWR
jgi:hypothetical protein